MELGELITSLREHGEKYPAEKEATLRMIEWIEKHGEFAFVRENLDGHLTGSFMVTNPSHTKILLMFHHKLQMWLQFGGHADGEVDLRAVAIREFHEESGIIEEPRFYTNILDIDIHRIPARGYELEHFHYDAVFLGEVSEDVQMLKEEGKVDDIRWFDIEGIEKYIAEPRMLSMIEKIKNL